MMGHALAGSGAIEIIACAMTLFDQIIHPTINYETPDPDVISIRTQRGRDAKDCAMFCPIVLVWVDKTRPLFWEQSLSCTCFIRSRSICGATSRSRAFFIGISDMRYNKSRHRNRCMDVLWSDLQQIESLIDRREIKKADVIIARLMRSNLSPNDVTSLITIPRTHTFANGQTRRCD